MSKLKNLSLLFVTLLSFNSYASYIACNDKEIYNEVSKAAVRNDTEAFQYLVYESGHCLPTDLIVKNNLKYSVIDYGWATSKIRVYGGGKSMVFYVQSEFLKSQKI